LRPLEDNKVTDLQDLVTLFVVTGVVAFGRLSAALEGDELAERVRKNRREGFERIRRGGIESRLSGCVLGDEGQQCVDRLTDVGP
jgi:hypothetical protein